MTFSTWSYTSDLTVWPVTYDTFGQPVVGDPINFKGTFGKVGELQRDASGDEFIPSSTYWTRQDVQVGWKIAKGKWSGVPPTQAEIIRKVEEHDSTMHGDAGIDRVVHT